MSRANGKVSEAVAQFLYEETGGSPPPFADNVIIVIGSADRTIFGGGFILARDLTGSVGNPHGFDENSTLDRTGTVSMNAFDARTQIKNNTYGHYNAFQHDAVVSDGAVLDQLNGFSEAPSIDGASVYSRTGVWVSDVVPTNGGTLTEQYGIRVAQLSGGSDKNWAIYAGGPESWIGGGVLIGGIPRTRNGVLDVFGGGNFTSGGTDSTNVIVGGAFPTGRGGLYLIGDGVNGSDIQSILEGTGYSPLRLQKRGGNVGIGNTASPASKLTVTDGDIEVTDVGSGFILKSPDGTRYRITVANGGALSATAV